jgi:hypothetical protein
MANDDLKLLPTEVKSLVNDGIYALYVVKNRPEFAYVLVVSGHAHPLSRDGKVVDGIALDSIRGLELGGAVRFSDVQSRPSLTLNYAW